MKQLSICTAAFVLLLASSVFSQSSNPAAATPEQQIRTQIAAFSQHLMNSDWEAVAASYTEDAKLMPPGQDIIQGRAAIQQIWEKGGKVYYHKITPSEIVITGNDTAYDWGYYEGRSPDKEGKETAWKGKYIILWKQTAPGEWKIYADIWNRVP